MLVLCWKRSDLRESSRLVTFLSAERGRFTCLAKGAHRRNSQALGRLDFLNRLDVVVTGRGFPLLSRVRIVHEPRGLRRPARFAVANHLVDLFDRAFVQERADPELFDLAIGSFTLAERAGLPNLPVAIAAIELRLLAALGLLGDLRNCAACGTPLQAGASVFARPHEAGLQCAAHRPDGGVTLAPGVHERLAALLTVPGRALPSFVPGPGFGAVLACCGRWIESSLEHRTRFRAVALAACAP